MAAVVTEAWTGSQLTLAFQLAQWQALRIFQVSGATSKTDAINALQSSSFAVQVGSAHPDNNLLICNQIACDDSLVLRKVTATYTVTANANINPLFAKPRLRWKTGVRMERSDYDYYGNAKLNSAGVPFDPPSQRPRGMQFLTVVRTEPFFDVQRSVSLQNTTNSAAITIPGAGVIQPGQMFCHSMECPQDIYQGIPYCDINYNFELRGGNLVGTSSEYDGFFDSQLDQGDSGWYSGTSSDRGIICNSTGVETGNVLLDGTGKPLDSSLKILSKRDGSVASPIANPTALPTNVSVVTMPVTGAKRLLYRDFGTYDFNALNLFVPAA